MNTFAAALATMRTVLGNRSSDPDALMTLTDALLALGSNGHAGQRQDDIPVSSVVGTVARSEDFDPSFRPRRPELRDRRHRLAEAGVELPPIDVVALGQLYFVRDGHHRVSLAKERGQQTITARVQQICTVAFGMCCLRLAHLPAKAAERVFLERVPLPDDVRADLWLDEPRKWMRLADAAAAWAWPRRDRINDNGGLAVAWWLEEVLPVVSRVRAVVGDAWRYDVGVYLAALEARDRLGALEWSPNLSEELAALPHPA